MCQVHFKVQNFETDKNKLLNTNLSQTLYNSV